MSKTYIIIVVNEAIKYFIKLFCYKYHIPFASSWAHHWINNRVNIEEQNQHELCKDKRDSLIDIMSRSHIPHFFDEYFVMTAIVRITSLEIYLNVF